MFPDLSALPILGQVIIYSIFGVSLSIVVILTWLGFKVGQKGPAPGNDQARVAAVIVEPAALIAATKAVEELGDDVRALTDSIKAMTLEMVRNARSPR